MFSFHALRVGSVGRAVLLRGWPGRARFLDDTDLLRDAVVPTPQEHRQWPVHDARQHSSAARC